MTQMLLIGDIHGKWNQYIDILREHRPENSVQLGDFGIGFHGEDPEKVKQLKSDMNEFGDNNKFIRGNHDNLSVCKTHESWIPDATFDDDHGIFYLGGALSIDRAIRYEGIDWWGDEELSYDELYSAIDVYEKSKPRIVLSHECPEDIIGYMMNYYKAEFQSRTRQALSSMWSIHKPELWVFGHWHTSVTATFDGCQFTCLNELEHMTINI